MEETTRPCQQLVQSFVKGIAPKIERFKEGFDWSIMFELFDDAIQAVEEMEEIEGGAAKKACAVEIILAVYDEYKIDIPFLPAMFEKQALKFIINYAIDGIVAILNKRGVFVHDAPTPDNEI
ncbi:MAG: hypothetical protein JW934_08630 [Anaerolineae bacterium]|nr:hypothetical protein [Anaerolineae bacterium]